MSEIIRTVLGDIDRSEPGICQCHEHLFLEMDKSYEISKTLYMDDLKKSTEELVEYRAAGGSLIVEASAAFGPGGNENRLSQVLGIEGRGQTGGVAHYLGGLDARLPAGTGLDPLIVEGEAYHVTLTTASPLAFYRYEVTDRRAVKDLYHNLPPHRKLSNDPLITLNAYGKGRALYLAVPLTTVEIRNHHNNPLENRTRSTQLAANLARFMLDAPVLRGTTPAGVELVVNQQPGRTLVHVLNNYVARQYEDSRPSLLKLADVPVSINEQRIGPITRAYRLSQGKPQELLIQRDGPWAEVRLPELGVHALIILEHG